MKKELQLGDIRADTSAQPRASILTDKVAEYVERMSAGDEFPPIVVFFDGEVNWIADGFHRYHAAVGMGLTSFPCDVREGGLRDAVLFSCGANAAHGVPRTNEDKRRAVLKLLQDAEWSHWSDREIAKRAAVSHEFVRRLRPVPDVTVNVDSEPRTFTTKHGTVAKMNTAAIGKNRVEPVGSGADPAEQAAKPVKAAKTGAAPAAKPQRPAHGQSPARDHDDLRDLQDENTELHNAVEDLKQENAALKAENSKLADRLMLYERGGVDGTIKHLEDMINRYKHAEARESADKAAWKRSADYWKLEAAKLGWSRNTVIDLDTLEEVKNA
ncbi:MAG: hypothetical protein NVS3B5_02200 [Sphingomicrobium sp.]